MKFFLEAKNYGFIVADPSPYCEGGTDLFFHYDDMKKTNLSKQFLKDVRDRFNVRLKFRVMAYVGKYNHSQKAVDIELVKIEPLAPDTVVPPNIPIPPSDDNNPEQVETEEEEYGNTEQLIESVLPIPLAHYESKHSKPNRPLLY